MTLDLRTKIQTILREFYKREPSEAEIQNAQTDPVIMLKVLQLSML